jgi:hypothetical protein
VYCFYLAEFPTHVFGEHLKQQVEDRLKFYETGDAPAKNVDVMKIAVEEASYKFSLVIENISWSPDG